MTETSSTGPSETRILLYVLAQLRERYPDSLWERQNVIVAQAGDRVIRANTKGSADIRGCHQGRGSTRGVYIELEIKTPNGQQTPSQRKRQEVVTRAGGVYAVVHNLAEALVVITSLDAQGSL